MELGRLQLSRARLLEAGGRRVVPLTFVEKLLCGRDTNCEEWGQMAMIGRSCVGREEPGRQPKAVWRSRVTIEASEIQLKRACAEDVG